MALKKPSVLKAIRRQVAAQHRLKATALAGSGYANLQIRNARREGMPVPQFDNEERRITVVPLKPRAIKTTKKTTRRPVIKAPPPKPDEPEIESWNPAGGKFRPMHETERQSGLSSTLGIARIASWRGDLFIEQLRTLLEQHAEFDDIEATEFDYGGEMMIDVYVRFRSELIAEAAKDEIDGETLGGKILRVTYA